jgi:hypothetical protein
VSAVTLAELEMLRVALVHWRLKLSERIAGGITTPKKLEVHQSMIRRHRIVLAAAARGEVPACE